MTWTVTWIGRRGEGKMRNFHTEDDVVTFIRTLRMDATVRDEFGRTVGGVDRHPGAIDQRIKWLWWLDPVGS